MKIKPGTVVRQSPCASCPFRDDGGIGLTEVRMAEIKCYLMEGQNHFCHSDDTHKTVCRGGRTYQLRVWHAVGLLEAPTDAALRSAMEKQGIRPREHIGGSCGG